jgi:hypothetical protein
MAVCTFLPSDPKYPRQKKKLLFLCPQASCPVIHGIRVYEDEDEYGAMVELY